MASLSVRKLDSSVYNRLRIRAAQHGISMEEEARQILSQALSVPEKISDIFCKHFGKDNGVDLALISERTPHDPMDFNE